MSSETESKAAEPKVAGPSPKAKSLSARLRAVQAFYQKMQNDQSTRSLVNEYMSHRREMDAEGEELVKPDDSLFKKIIYGVDERRPELESIIDSHLKKDSPNRNVEPLMRALLLCASYELMAGELDSPIIINDYLNVGHAFYSKNEVALINGVLDNVAKLFK
jgi:N utilization substance protein B